MPPLDPTLSLAITLNRTKGATALLLGSGISSAAGILTGWGITLDLTQQIAALQKEEPLPDPAAWYEGKFGQEPDYAELLEQLAPTPTERRQLLHNYFVPTDEEREQHLKEPTQAHRAIADLVSRGYIRVILTTNFDPLLEKALEDIGVLATLVSDVSAIKGMMPMQFSPVTIIKLHGHYLDTRLRNTPAELATYEPELNTLLDRVFDEYGLLIAGWSGVWDTALRDALLRCPTRRFSTYWTTLGDLASGAKQVAQHRAAEIITIKGADSFFQDLQEKVLALEELAQPRSVSTAVAVATLKRYLPVEAQRIRLHDLVTEEVERVWELAGSTIPTAVPNEVLMKKTILALDQLQERVLYFLGMGTYWGGPTQPSLWLNSVTRLSKLKVEPSSYGAWMSYREYPMVLAFYAVGLGAVAAHNYELLMTLLLDTKLHVNQYPDQTAGQRLDDAIDHRTMQALWDGEVSMPLSRHLERVFRPVFVSVLPDEPIYQGVFDELEYLMALTFRGEWLAKKGNYSSDYYRGLYMVRGGWARRNVVIDQVRDRIVAQAEKGPLLRRGLFNGSTVQQGEVMADLDQTMERFRRER
ncbi:MAG: SIR2 family protein [Janthinobacterium lividum]